MSELIFLDLEWNSTFYRNAEGKRLPFHELIEVAAIKVDQDSCAMLDSFHSYVHPTASPRIAYHTYAVLPYSREELACLLMDAPGFPDLGPAFLRWCGSAPVFVEWGNNDVSVLLDNFHFHRLPLDKAWKCEYFDLQYIFQTIAGGEPGLQPSLEKAVTSLALDTNLDFHSAWNDAFYTVQVYQALTERYETMSLFHRPPRQKGPVALWEMDLGTYVSRWDFKKNREVAKPLCPICGKQLKRNRWVRTAAAEYVMRCLCREHRHLYLVVTARQDGKNWTGHAAIYKSAGEFATRYHKTCRMLKMRSRRSL